MRQFTLLLIALSFLSGCYLFEREKTVEVYGSLLAANDGQYRLVLEPEAHPEPQLAKAPEDVDSEAERTAEPSALAAGDGGAADASTATEVAEDDGEVASHDPVAEETAPPSVKTTAPTAKIERDASAVANTVDPASPRVEADPAGIDRAAREVARDVAEDVARDVAVEAARDQAEQVAEDVAKDGATDVATDVATRVANDAAAAPTPVREEARPSADAVATKVDSESDGETADETPHETSDETIPPTTDAVAMGVPSDEADGSSPVERSVDAESTSTAAESPTPVVARVVRTRDLPESDARQLAIQVDRIHRMADRLLEAKALETKAWNLALGRDASLSDVIALALVVRNWNHEAGYQTVASAGGELVDVGRVLEEIERDLRLYAAQECPDVSLDTVGGVPAFANSATLGRDVVALWEKIATLHGRTIDERSIGLVLGRAVVEAKRVLRQNDPAARYRIDARAGSASANADSVDAVCQRIRAGIQGYFGGAANEDPRAPSAPQLFLDTQLILSDLGEIRRLNGVFGPTVSASERTAKSWADVEGEANLVLLLIEQFPAWDGLN